MKNLLKKLSEIRKQTGFIKKAKVGENLSYKAVSADMVLFEVRNLIDNQNLFLSTQVLKEELEIKERTEMRWNKYEKKEEQKYLVNFITKLDILYTWYDVDTGESLDVQWKCTAHNTDPAKSNGSALTYAEKYFFLKYFNIISSENEKLDPDCQKVEEVEIKKQQDIQQNKNQLPKKDKTETHINPYDDGKGNTDYNPNEKFYSPDEPHLEEKETFDYVPNQKVLWTPISGNTITDKQLYEKITTSFINIVIDTGITQKNKLIKLDEISKKYCDTYQGLTMKDKVIQIPYNIAKKDIERM